MTKIKKERHDLYTPLCWIACGIWLLVVGLCRIVYETYDKVQ